MAARAKRPEHCVRCSRAFTDDVRHAGHGKCRACYTAGRRRSSTGTRVRRDVGDVLDRYVCLRAQSDRPSMDRCSVLLDIPRSTLSKILREAAEAGDARSDWGSQRGRKTR
jgi:hypothetical protein